MLLDGPPEEKRDVGIFLVARINSREKCLDDRQGVFRRKPLGCAVELAPDEGAVVFMGKFSQPSGRFWQ